MSMQHAHRAHQTQACHGQAAARSKARAGMVRLQEEHKRARKQLKARQKVLPTPHEPRS